VVSGCVIAVLLHLIPLAAVGDALSRVSAWTWAASVAIFFAGHYLNAIKLRLLLGSAPHSADGAPQLMSSCVRAQYAGLVANLGLPGLAGGDLVRAVYLAPSVGLARVTVASVADRLIDTATVLTLVVIALPIAGMPPAISGVVRQAGLWIAVAVPLVVAGVLAARYVFSKPAVSAKTCRLRSAFSARPRGRGLRPFAISFAVQSAFVMTNVWLARQVGVTTSAGRLVRGLAALQAHRDSPDQPRRDRRARSGARVAARTLRRALARRCSRPGFSGNPCSSSPASWDWR
jgi:hypothetical protein